MMIGFGHAPEHEQHHFVVAIPRAQMAEVMIYEVFERDLVGPELIAANLAASWTATAGSRSSTRSRRNSISDSVFRE
jgi:hypothetical protein